VGLGSRANRELTVFAAFPKTPHCTRRLFAPRTHASNSILSRL
jgi:hypothetical protein